MTGRITELGFDLSTSLSNDETILQQAEKPGIHRDFTCMKFSCAAIVDVIHKPYRPVIEAAGKGLLNI
jgi:ferredoxin